MVDRLEEILGILGKKIEPHLEAVEKVAQKVGVEIENFMNMNYDTMGLLVSAMIDDEKTQEMFLMPFEYSAEGQDKVASRMGIEYNNFNIYLNTQGEDRQDVVGFYDGYLASYLGTSTERLPFSQEYKDAVEIGKKIGGQTQFWLFADINEVEKKINPDKLMKKVGGIVREIFPE